jgi:hypothetical protein
MATIETVRAAIVSLTALLDGAEPDFRRRVPNRTVSLWVKDLDVAFAGRLQSGSLVDVVEIEPADRTSADLKVAMSSDDLVEVVEGRLHVASGMAHGRIRVDARFRDVLELRKFL